MGNEIAERKQNLLIKIDEFVKRTAKELDDTDFD